MNFLMTNDVETTSLELNRPADFMIKKIKNIGLPRLIELYSKYDVESTFFFTAYIVKKMPEIIDIVKENDHEIGCHGYKHEPEYFFDSLSLKKQIHYLRLSKKIIEKEANTKVISFRAPELLLNGNTIMALEKTGFKYDSSIPPQRIDGPLSRGFNKKIKWLWAPRKPYNPSSNSIIHRGDSQIIEIPISSFIFSYMGTTMRISSKINKIVQKIIFREAKNKGIPIVFIMHPTEVIKLDNRIIKKPVIWEESFFSGILRKKLKYKNLGKASIKLTEAILINAKKNDAEFFSISTYGKKCLGVT